MKVQPRLYIMSTPQSDRSTMPLPTEKCSSIECWYIHLICILRQENRLRATQLSHSSHSDGFAFVLCSIYTLFPTRTQRSMIENTTSELFRCSYKKTSNAFSFNKLQSSGNHVKSLELTLSRSMVTMCLTWIICDYRGTERQKRRMSRTEIKLVYIYIYTYR